MIQAGMEMGPNAPYGQYISRSSSKWYGLYHISRHFCLSKVINNNKKWDIQVNRWVCVLSQQHAVSAGMSLLRCGEAQKQLGEAEKKFVQSTDIHFLTPLRSFSDGEYKALQVRTCASITAMFTTFFVSRLFHIVFRSFTGRAQDVVEQTLGLGHRSFQTEKSPWGRQWGQSEFWNREKKRL